MATTNDLIPDFEDFERYYSGEMSSAEQRTLEGRMLAEPLIAEAYEGFLAWSAHNAGAERIRTDLHERLHARVARSRRYTSPMWAYASAASVVLALFSYWFVFVRDQKVDKQETAVAGQQETAPSKPAQAPVRPEEPPTLSAATPVTPETPNPVAKIQAGQAKQPNPISPAAETLLAPSSLADAEVREEANDIALADSFQVKKEVAEAAPLPAKALTTPGSSQAVGKSMAGRARMEREEVDTQHFVASKPVVAGGKTYSVTVSADTLPPMPAQGWETYRAYLEKNTGAASTTGQIVVTFFVSSTGVLSGFVTTGPEELRKEAIRIIINGPAWVPARTKGAPVTSRTEIQLQFRQSQ